MSRLGSLAPKWHMLGYVRGKYFATRFEADPMNNIEIGQVRQIKAEAASTKSHGGKFIVRGYPTMSRHGQAVLPILYADGLETVAVLEWVLKWTEVL